MRKLLALAAVLVLSVPLLAEQPVRALFKESWGGIYCNSSVQQIPDKTGMRTLLKTEDGPVTITKSGYGYVFQFPKWSANVQEQVDGSLKLRFGPDTFLFNRSKKAFQVVAPTDTITYTLTGGRVTAIRGKQGSVNIRTTFATNTYTIFGPNGKSRLQLQPRGKKNAVAVLDGEPIEQIPYLVQGFRFEDTRTGVGIFVAVPGGKLTSALPWGQAFVYHPPLPNPVPVAEAREPNPLQAVTGNGDPLNAVVGSPKDIEGRFPAPGEDWLKMRPTPKGEDHIKANLGDPNEDPLGLGPKGVDPIVPPTGGSNPTSHPTPSSSSSSKSAPQGGHDPAEDDLAVP